VLFVLGCIAVFFFNLFVVDAYLREKYKPATLAAMTRLFELRRDPEKLQQKVARDLYDVTLYDLDHGLVFSSLAPPAPPLSPAQLSQLLRERVLLLSYFDARGAAVCADESGRPAGYAVVTERMPFRQLAFQAAAVVVLALILVLGSLPLARSIVMPLEKLVGTVRAFGDGDLRARADAERGDEIGELGRAFNDMAGRIAALLRSEKELIANVSHELRTPLARIRVVLELAEERPESTRRYLAEVARDLGELERLVDDVLTAARLDLAEGRVGDQLPPLRRLRVEPGEVVEEAAERFRQAHPGRPLRLDVGEGLPALDADPVLLRRALDNLLDNAQKYSDGASPVALDVRAGPGEVSFRVRDQGIGVDEADLPRLFSPFFRTDRSRDRTTGGLGLGLTLTKRIIEAHGGSIGLDSRPGVGTTVSFAIPARDVAPETPG
jgi:signal transduction histidine kinase